MNQKHVSHLIDDYVDGVLNTEDRKLVELHIQDCSKCQKELSSVEGIVHDLHRLPKSIVPPDQLKDAVDQQLLQYGSNHHATGLPGTGGVHILRSPWILRIAAGIAILIGSGILIWFSLQKSQEHTNTVVQQVDTSRTLPSVSPTIESPAIVEKKNSIKTVQGQHIATDVPESIPQDSALNTIPTPLPMTHLVDTQDLHQLPSMINPVEPPHQVRMPDMQNGTGCLTGTIVDKSTGEGLIGVNVIVQGTSLGAATDIDGNYRITGIPPGNYNVSASYVGYEKQSIANVSVPTNSPRQLDFKIAPTAIAAEEVVITMQMRGQKASSNQQMKSSGAKYATSESKVKELPDENTAEAVGRLPGVGIQRSSGEKSTVVLRGLSSQYSNITIDGTRTPSPSQSSFNTEEYSKIDDNEFKEALANPLSTFSIDVDAASYSNVRRFIQNGQLPPHDAVRIEEMINYFKYDYPQPYNRHPFTVNTELAVCPWNTSNALLLVGLQGKIVDEHTLPPSNLVFLLDVSGSMDEPNKLPLEKAAFRLLVRQLRPQDRIAIVTYNERARVVLPSTSGDDKEEILDAIESLHADGSTAGAEGLQLAYDIARRNFMRSGNNRVILATDGDFNVGMSSEGELIRLIEEERKDNIFLSVLGLGTDNFKDAKLEKLADKGNGNFSYIDNLQEARKVLVEQMAGTLYAIAKDVKIQVEFNPALVKSYRLIGYENRLLNKEDFKDDKKDAGELGSGHTVTALYELVLNSESADARSSESLKYQSTKIKPESFRTDELLTVQLRYKLPTETSSILMTRPVKKDVEEIEDGSRNIKFASAVAMFGMILRESKFKADADYDLVLKYAKEGRGIDEDGYNAEFIKLVETCRLLGGRNGR